MLMAFSCGLMGFHRADLHNLQKKKEESTSITTSYLKVNSRVLIGFCHQVALGRHECCPRSNPHPGIQS